MADQFKTECSIVLVTEGLAGQPGGIQRVSRGVAEAAKCQEGDWIFWSSNDISPREAGRIKIRGFGGDYRRMLMEACVSELPAHCEKISCWHLALSPIAAILATRLHCSYDIFLHGIEAWGSLSPWQHLSVLAARRVAANSTHTLRMFRARHPHLAHVPGRVLSLGLNAELVGTASPGGDAARRVSTPRADDPYFLTVTRLGEDYKGEKWLLKSFAALRLHHPRVRLICVGEGPSRASLEEYARNLNLDATAVVFTGRVDDARLAELYAGCLGFALLSTGEGFGLVFLEAMYWAKPCIGVRGDASEELVRDGVTGFTVPPGDAPAVVNAMESLFLNPELQKRMGENGQRDVKEKYMPEHFQRRLGEYLVG